MTDPKEKSLPDFLELKLQGGEPSWCVDGRPDFNHPKGAQMLGGSLLPLLLIAISKNLAFDEQTVKQGLSSLQKAGYTTGVHRGAHKQPEQSSSDCGFADRMPTILQTTLSRREEISRRLNAIYETNKGLFRKLGKAFVEMIDDAFAKIESYPPEKIVLTGERLIARVEQRGTVIENVLGDHAEEVAFVNLRQGTTLDTNQMNRQGRQAFNLDLWLVADQARRLGIDSHFALGASLILYLATEMVLVENKGKPVLSMVIR